MKENSSEKIILNKEKFLNLLAIEKNLSFEKRLQELFDKKILFENENGKKYMLQTGSRIAVIADVNGVKIPFYQSSTGTDGKISGNWYPFFGNGGSWLVKGSTKDSHSGYHIPEVKEMMDYLDSVLPEYLYLNLLNSEQKKVFSVPSFQKQISKSEQVKQMHKEFILNTEEAAEYMAKILIYNVKDIPGASTEKNVSEFLKNILKSIRQKLEIFRQF